MSNVVHYKNHFQKELEELERCNRELEERNAALKKETKVYIYICINKQLSSSEAFSRNSIG